MPSSEGTTAILYDFPSVFLTTRGNPVDWSHLLSCKFAIGGPDSLAWGVCDNLVLRLWDFCESYHTLTTVGGCSWCCPSPYTPTPKLFFSFLLPLVHLHSQSLSSFHKARRPPDLRLLILRSLLSKLRRLHDLKNTQVRYPSMLLSANAN